MISRGTLKDVDVGVLSTSSSQVLQFQSVSDAKSGVLRAGLAELTMDV